MNDPSTQQSADESRTDALERRERDNSEDHRALKKSIEQAAKIYFETCRKLARGISRLKSDNRE